jgi:RiboL-PSP-HEPN
MTPVDILNQEYQSIVGFLNDKGQPSMSSDVDKHFKKVITLSSASYFEHKIREILIGFITRGTNNNNLMLSFFKKKAIERQYHTYFSWEEKDKPGKSANSFFSLFGEDFKKEVTAEIKASELLDDAVKSFLEIGYLRNILIHSNLAAYDIQDKTAGEIFTLYKKGLIFIEYMEKKLCSAT